MNELIKELKVKIIETLNLIDVVPENIDENAQLIGGDLGLDSIDVLELVMMLEKDYGVKIDSRELGVKVFASVAALADYVHHYQSVKNN
jgi:acyl carrier protein